LPIILETSVRVIRRFRSILLAPSRTIRRPDFGIILTAWDEEGGSLDEMVLELTDEDELVEAEVEDEL